MFSASDVARASAVLVELGHSSRRVATALKISRYAVTQNCAKHVKVIRPFLDVFKIVLQTMPQIEADHTRNPPAPLIAPQQPKTDGDKHDAEIRRLKSQIEKLEVEKDRAERREDELRKERNEWEEQYGQMCRDQFAIESEKHRLAYKLEQMEMERSIANGEGLIAAMETKRNWNLIHDLQSLTRQLQAENRQLRNQLRVTAMTEGKHKKEIGGLRRDLGLAEYRVQVLRDELEAMPEPEPEPEPEPGFWDAKIERLKERFPILYQILRKMNVDEPEHSRGLHWPAEVKDFVIFLSQMGEYWYGVISKQFGLPCFRTAQRYVQHDLDLYGIKMELLSGGAENIQTLVDMFLPAGSNRKVILAIDACSATPSVAISETGLVTGLIDEMQLSREDTKRIKESVREFREFLKSQKDNIVRYHFVVLAIPLDEAFKPFPILVSRKKSGTADASCDSEFRACVTSMRAAGAEVVGVAFDGDQKWLSFVRVLTKNLQSMFSIGEIIIRDAPLSSCFENPPTLPFEDLLHLLKILRYRLSCGASVCVWPDNHDNMITPTDWAEIGIPEWITCDDSNKKMEDALPLHMFRKEFLINAYLAERYDLFLLLLPCVMLRAAVMTPEQKKGKIEEQLTYVFAFLALYNDARGMDPEQKPNKKETVDGTSRATSCMCFLDETTVEKMISLCLSLAILLKTPGDINLGRAGTHLLEHLFGMVRRLCMRDDSSVNFERVILRILLSRLKTTPHQYDKGAQPKRVSDSGGRATGELESIITVKRACLDMMDIVIRCGRTLSAQALERREEWMAEMPWRRGMTLEEILTRIPEDEKWNPSTTTQADMCISGGKTGFRRLASQTSLTRTLGDIADQTDDEDE